MARARLTSALLLTALAVALLAPVASAHTEVFSADHRVRGSVGLLNEPVSTYAVTGLDVCFTHATAAPRAPLPKGIVNPGNFTATLTSPSGKTHTALLEVPFGRDNCLTFEDPLVLTEPGQYLMKMSGLLNGTSIDFTDIKAGGVVVAREEITFPAVVDSDEQLQARITALEAKVASMEADEASHDDDEKGAPAPVAGMTFVLLAVLAAARRLR
jgi:hypothetical protein